MKEFLRGEWFKASGKAAIVAVFSEHNIERKYLAGSFENGSLSWFSTGVKLDLYNPCMFQEVTQEQKDQITKDLGL